MTDKAGGIGIVHVRDEDAAGDVRRVAHAFREWNYRAMPDLAPLLDAYFAAQDFDRHLGDLLTRSNPPDGECLLARFDGEPVGIVMLKRRSPAEAELNRLFVVETARGRGVARTLVTQLIKRARDLGYGAIVLDALDRQEAAIALYRSLGFVDDPGANRDDDASVHLRLILD